MASAKGAPKEGRVNVPLGENKSELRRLSAKEGTTETNLARLLILDGINRLKTGELKFRGPSIEQSTTR